MARRYAEGTNVDNSKSRYEIERLLRMHGAGNFAYASGDQGAMIAFSMEGRYYRLQIPMPDRDSEEFTLTPAKRFERTKAEADKAFEQEINRRWRVLFIAIKAKLELIEMGLSTVEQEFLAATVTPNGMTVGEYMTPHLEAAYAGGQALPQMPWNCLPAPGSEVR